MNQLIGITKTRLNLRSGPGMEYDVLSVLETGAMIVVLHDMGAWLNVQAAGTTGYVQEEFVALSGHDAHTQPWRQTSAVTSGNPGVVTTYLNLRRGPGIDYEVIRTLEEGAILDVLEPMGEWLNVHFEGVVGFVMDKYIDWEAPVITAEPDDPEPEADGDPLPQEEQPAGQTEDGEDQPAQAPEEVEEPVAPADGDPTPAVEEEPEVEQTAPTKFTKPSLTLFGLHTFGTLNDPGRLFAGPGRDYPVLLEVPAGQPFLVLEDAGAWLNILASDTHGYIPQEGVDLAVKPFGRITEAQNLRGGPGEEYETTLPLLSGEAVEILEDMGGWLEISVDGQRGFVPANAIERPQADLIEPAAEGPATQTEADISEFLPTTLTGPTLAPGEAVVVDPQAPLETRLIAETWNRFGGLVADIAEILALDPAVALSVLAVEAGGRCFGPDGRMMIRFENHVFWHFWGRHHQETFDRHFQFDPEFPWRGHRFHAGGQTGWGQVHGSGQGAEWQAYELAAALDRTSARLSASLGAPQIMGFNFEALGYESVDEMWATFAAGEKQQVEGFFRFLSDEHIEALRQMDFAGFARLYNGEGLAEKYGQRIHEGVERFHMLTGLE